MRIDTSKETLYKTIVHQCRNGNNLSKSQHQFRGAVLGFFPQNSWGVNGF
jgi:hypothetical protein